MDLVGVQGRGQSEVLGLVLLFALVVSVTAAVVVVGGQAINDAQDSTSQASAEQTMLELQSKADQSSGGSTQEVSFAETGGGSDVQAADGRARVEKENSVSVDDNAGELRIAIENADGTDPPVLTESLGRVTYQEGGETLVYQGGGVFRKNAGSEESVIVSAPDFTYKHENGEPTLSIGITTLSTSGNGVTDSSFAIRQTNSEQHYPSADTSNPLESGDSVTIFVESEYYRAWEDFFEDRTGIDADTGDFNGNGQYEVKFTLDGPPAGSPVTEAALSSSDVNKVNPSNKVTIDSYTSDSSPNEYDRSNGPVYVRGKFLQSNEMTHKGDLYVRDRAKLDIAPGAGAGMHVDGDVHTGGTPLAGDPTIIGGVSKVGGDVSTTDDLRIEGENSAKRVIIRGNVYVGTDSSSASIEYFDDAKVKGDVHVQGDIADPVGDVEIRGDLYVEGNIDKSEWEPHVTDTIYDGPDSATPAEPPNIPPISNKNAKIDTYEDEHDDPSENNNENPVTGDTREAIEKLENGNCDACTLSSESGGRDYYIDGGISLSDGDTLTFDTSDGPINVYVGPNADGNQDGIYMRKSNIKVDGNNPVQIFSDGTLYFDEGSEVTTSPTDHRAQNFRVYVRTHRESGGQNSIYVTSTDENPTQITGVFRGPGDPDGAKVKIDGDAEIYGAVSGDVSNIAEKAEIHFDEALLDSGTADERSGGQGSITYLGVTEREVELDE